MQSPSIYQNRQAGGIIMRLLSEDEIVSRLSDAKVLPLDEKLLQLIIKVLIFAKDRQRAKMGGRLELHADDSGNITKCPRYVHDCLN